MEPRRRGVESLLVPTETALRPAVAAVVDLRARRVGRGQALERVASAPVRYVPAELLEALQGSWGTPEELGLAPQRRALRIV